MQLYSIFEYNNYYYNEERPVADFAVKKWSDKNKTWQQLSEEERVKAGKERAQDHNKAIKYEKTYKENLILLKELSQYCEEKQINLIFVVAPASKYYRDALLKKYKEDFYNALNMAGGVIHVVDEYEDELFGVDDFNDMDHLNNFGAQKLTALLLEVIKQINIDN